MIRRIGVGGSAKRRVLGKGQLELLRAFRRTHCGGGCALHHGRLLTMEPPLAPAKFSYHALAPASLWVPFFHGSESVPALCTF
jgi:hypothetical protein